MLFKDGQGQKDQLQRNDYRHWAELLNNQIKVFFTLWSKVKGQWPRSFFTKNVPNSRRLTGK